uniref:Si:ch211-194b1.1 n=1 Tax=Cyclopterus lumpus TaxID=8103 RepID=A0A8C3G9N8_CYCLU
MSEGFLDEDPDGIDEDSEAVMHCEFCSAGFDTRAGLSSHARAHLRDFGITNWDVTISPIHILRELFSSRPDLPRPLSPAPAGCQRLGEQRGANRPPLTKLPRRNSSVPQKDEDLGDMDLEEKATPLSILSKAAKAVPPSSSTPSPSLGAYPAPPHSGSPSSVVRKAPFSSLLPVSSPLRSLEHKDIVCQLCGAWFETRKGLSSHARAHLRHFGVEYSESKGSPIDLLNQLIDTDDFKHKAGALQLDGHAEPRGLAAKLSAPKRSLLSLASSSSLLCEPPKEIGCEFCGEYFENRKGLSSHWTVNGSPIDTLREIITRRGLPCALPLKPLKPPPPLALPTFASGLILKLKPEPVQLEVTTPGAAGRSASISGEALNCSWSTMAHEMEPTRDIRCEFCGEYFENRKGLSSHARSHLRQMGITEWIVNGSPIDTLREVMHKRGVGPSSHQGVKKETSQGASSPLWENTEGLGVSGYQSKFRKSPLSLLQSGSRLHKQGLGSTSTNPPAGKFFRLSPLGKRPLSEEAQPVETANSPCELCGFFFENRKALASHARAHLRQFGVTEWCVNGSPIETLSAWMRSRPQKVLEMHRSYMQGNRTTLKKVSRGNALLEVLANHPKAGSTPGCSQQGGGTADPDWGHRGSAGRLWGGFTNIPDGTESPPKPPRTGTIPALVPKPPSYPLVKLVGKFYTLKCRFCEVEFHGPLSVQEDWIRHLQQHILKMNYNKARIVSPPKSPQAPFEAAFWTVTKSCYQGNEALLAYPLQQVW